MGKCVRIRSSSSNHPSPSPSPSSAAAHLTLRSGRRVPMATAAAACCSSPGRRHRRGSSACYRWCGPKGRAYGCKSVGPTPAVLACGGGRPEKEEEDKTPPPSSEKISVAGDVVDVNCRRDSNEPNTPLAGDDAVRANNPENGNKSGVVVAGKPSPSPLVEAEIEAFFAAAEHAERRRFAAA
ncbi:hypothetical protein HU200_048918 [Digitaria exilis]|uniref:Cyclin-dependent kinase inhibitor n=1 Tax=Digitaria exilis TaxID=1010633 RepID=A0A835ECN6_9POAL|nr:hypothetical protein HU200_048918 [Digitaria exilis]